MKQTLITLLLFSIFTANLLAQNTFVGSYEGKYNGDFIYLTLKSDGANTLSGSMTDSQQKYVVNATTNGNALKGTAVEQTLGLTFVLNGTLNGTQLPMKMTLNANGQSAVLDVIFVKKGAISSATTTQQAPPQYANAKLPSGATHDPNLIGTWSKNEYYNSGYGSGAMSGNFSQSMILMADGSVSDGGSRAGISGNDYSGSSQGGTQALPNVKWYNIDKQFYLEVTQNGQTQALHLGKYYIENGKLLITGTNGQKLFMTRQ